MRVVLISCSVPSWLFSVAQSVQLRAWQGRLEVHGYVRGGKTKQSESGPQKKEDQKPWFSNLVFFETRRV